MVGWLRGTLNCSVLRGFVGGFEAIGGLKIVQFDWLLLKLINYSYDYKPIGVPYFDQLDVS